MEAMSDDLNVPDGFALQCQTCHYRPPENITIAVLAAHFETEHGTDKVDLDLVALCPRCDRAMRHDFTHGLVDHFVCDPCRRTREVRRGQ